MSGSCVKVAVEQARPAIRERAELALSLPPRLASRIGDKNRGEPLAGVYFEPQGLPWTPVARHLRRSLQWRP
jgi:hypothetical protein